MSFIDPGAWAGTAAGELYLVVRDTWTQMKRAQLLLVASSLAFITLLSIVPMLAVSFAIFHAFGGMEKLSATLEPFILNNLAEGTSDQAMQFLQTLVGSVRANIVGAGGFISLVITSMTMLSNVEKAVHQVWNEPIRRSFFARVASYWLFITLGPLALAVAVGIATSTGMALGHFLPTDSILYVVGVAVFFCVYKWVPSTRVNWEYALVSAVMTSVLWNLAREGYAVYTSRFILTGKIYGSLGAVPVFMLWIYILWVIVLTGAAVTAALQSRLKLTSDDRRGARA
jgi:membrane protein